MKRLALILLALVLLAPAAGAVEVWEKQLGSEITAIVTDETGAIIFVGTETGSVYRYDADGTQIGSPISFETCPVTNLVLTQDGGQLAVQYQETGTSAVYLVNTGTGAEWFSITDPGYQYGVAARPDGSAWYILAHESTDTQRDYLAVITPERGAWFVTADLLPGTFTVSGDGTWAAGAEGPTPTKADLISLSELPHLGVLPLLNELPLLSELPPLPDYGWAAYREITYRGSNLERNTQDIVVHRSTGNAYMDISVGLTTWHIYLNDGCKSDYGDIRFFNSTGSKQAYHLWPGYDAESARFTVCLENADEPGSLTVMYGNPTATTTSVSNATFPLSDVLLFDDFSGNLSNYNTGTLNNGTVEIDDGRLKIYQDPSGEQWWGAYAATNIKFAKSSPLEIQLNYSKPDGFAITQRIYAVTDSPTARRENFDYYRPETGESEIWENSVNSATMTPLILRLDGQGRASVNGGAWTTLANWYDVGETFDIELHNSDYSNHPCWFDDLRISSPLYFESVSTEVRTPQILAPAATKAYSGTITHIAGTEVGTRFAVATTSNLYLQQITESAFGDTVTLGPRAGTPYVLTLAHEGAFIVEGRNNLIDIFRTDGAQVGTYTAGGPVRHVDVAQANGLYAAGGSDDGKYYIFSKDVSSSWYLLHASDSASPVTALAMSWRGEIVLIGRSNGRLVAFQPAVEEEEYPGTIRLTVYKDALPYAGAQIALEHGGTDQTWGEATTIQTDDYGTASIPVRWGEYVRVTVGDGELQRVILPAPSQTDYVLRIKGPDPLRTGAQYSSGYDPDTQRIYLHYDDTREKTHLVVYTITRSTDNTVVFQKEYTTLPVDDYYQIPAGWTNSSYRIQLTASGSPSYTNTWSQWVGADGVAKLPADLDTYAKLGISFFLILFVAGLFSYISGPQGAVVVSLLAGALVLWGWLPLSPTIVALCIVWAFLGLLGRTSGE